MWDFSSEVILYRGCTPSYRILFNLWEKKERKKRNLILALIHFSYLSHITLNMSIILFSIGVCILLFSFVFSFNSKNKGVVGTVYKEMKGPLFPTVSVHSQNEEYVNLILALILSNQVWLSKLPS